MAKIRIVGTVSEKAQKEAPEWVRKAWVGLVLPFIDITCYYKGGETGIGEYELAGYCVKTEVAIEILRKKFPKVAKWWKEWKKRQQNNPYLKIAAEKLVFDNMVCELL